MYFILALFSLIIIMASYLKYTLGPVVMNGVLTTHYNNYLTFKFSFLHLIDYKDIYIYHPQDHWDLFKYSPAYAVFMGLYSYLPNLLGLILWNLTNFIPLFFAIKFLPGFTDKSKAFLLWFIFIELLTSIQNAQSNGLMLGLMIFYFNYLEEDKPALSSLFLLLSFSVKLFSIVALPLALFYPNKRKFVLYSILWTVLLAFIPLLFISFDQLIFTYKSWYRLLTTDYSESIGISVTAWLKGWFAFEPGNGKILLTGGLLLLLPLLNRKKWHDFTFRALYFAAMLIWVVIFNHKAESPTFIIAICGIGLWYFIAEKSRWSMIIVIISFVLTSLSATDLFPRFARHFMFYPYLFKVLPAIFIWCMIIFQLTFNKYKPRKELA
jgi:hypothetical protein